MTAPDLKCFHIAVVVDSLEKSIDAYKRFLGDGPWRTRDMGNGARIAYGAAGGQTWELIEVSGPGKSQFHEFRERHGEGVQHIGFWTPDIRTAVQDALASGAQMVSATTDEDGNASVQLLPAPEIKQEHIDRLGMAAWMDLGLGGWRLEYIASDVGQTFLREWLAEDYPGIILTPA